VKSGRDWSEQSFDEFYDRDYAKLVAAVGFVTATSISHATRSTKHAPERGNAYGAVPTSTCSRRGCGRSQ
jgi:hypothetical protein